MYFTYNNTIVLRIEHEIIGATLIFVLKKFVSEHKLGAVCGSSMGYWMKSENLR